MTKADTAKLIAVIVMAYPNFDKFKSDDHIEAMVNAWADIFKDDSGGLVGLAVKKHISISRFPPSIAEIREIMAEITNPDIIPPDEAWIAVSDMLYADSWGDSWKSNLPKLVVRACEAIGWQQLKEMRREAYTGGRPGFERVAFMDIYKPLYERAMRNAMLSDSIRSGIEKAALSCSTGERKLLETAQEARREKEDYYNGFFKRSRFRELEQSDELPALESGNTEDEE